MFESNSICSSVETVEKLLLDKFKNEPFHNLYLLYGKEPRTTEYGGSCSDKTLSFVRDARKAGFETFLHSGYIGGKEIHRLARLNLNGQIYFADIGNGWPALKLYPMDYEVSYSCFGMRFRTEIREHRIKVFHSLKGKETCQLEIDLNPKSEDEMKASIASRFNSGITYPFSNSLRFSLVVEDKFLFLRGDRLEIYGCNGNSFIDSIDIAQAPKIIQDYFLYDIEPLLSFLTSE